MIINMRIRHDDCCFCEYRFNECTVTRPKNYGCKYFKKDIDIVKEFNCYNCVRSRGPGYPSLDKKCLKCTSNNHYRNLPAGERDFYERRIYNEERFVETFR